MKIRITGNLILSLGMMLLFALLVVIGMRYNALARLLPMVVAVPGLILTAIQFIRELRSSLKAETAASLEEKKKETLSPQEVQRREKEAVGWLLAFFVLIYLFGFSIAILVFVLLFTKVFGRESWKLSIGMAVVLWAFVVVVFEQAMKSALYPGVILEWLQRYL